MEDKNKHTKEEFLSKSKELIDVVTSLGFPYELGILMARNLASVNTMERMINYLENVKPGRAEDAVDEMLAIMEDRNHWVQKKKAEEANAGVTNFYRSSMRAEMNHSDDDQD